MDITPVSSFPLNSETLQRLTAPVDPKPAVAGTAGATTVTEPTVPPLISNWGCNINVQG
jgi:hypothetical protein